MIKDSQHNEKNCLIIAIAHTKSVISVKDKTGKIAYPIRLETGLERVDYDKIRNSKRNIYIDSFDFILKLNSFTKSHTRI